MADLTTKPTAIEESHHTNGRDFEDRAGSVDGTRDSISSVGDYSGPSQAQAARQTGSTADPAMAKAVENILLSDVGMSENGSSWLC